MFVSFSNRISSYLTVLLVFRRLVDKLVNIRYASGNVWQSHKDKPKLYNFLQLPRFSQTFSHSDQLLKGCKLLCVISAKIWHPFSHHFFHFAADFVNLSYAKMAIFATL